MKKPIIAIIVFALGFTIGYLLTTSVFLDSSIERNDQVTPDDIYVATPASEHHGVVTATNEPAADDESETAETADSEENDTQTEQTTDDDIVSDNNDDETTDVIQPEAVKMWWDECLNTQCRVDFGGVTGSISIRDGSLMHKEQVSWQARFSNANKIGRLKVSGNTVVTLQAVSFADGEPSAALISYRDGRKVTGIIALKIGDNSIRMKPL